MTTNYLDSVADFYERVAETPAVGLCCVGGARLALPELCVPPDMEAMSYGCGSSVQPTDLSGSPRVVYVGVGGGKEALEFAYFSRAPGNAIAIEPVAAMRAVARRNLDAAAACNPWFDPAFVDIRAGDAFAFGLEDASVDIVGQNCHFNMFELDDLTRALCLSGALTYDAYIARLIDAGFGEIAIRARRPYRLLDAPTYGLDSPPFSATNRMFSFTESTWHYTGGGRC